MSFLKATWWRPATALAVLALAVLALSLSGAGTAHAGGAGAVTIDPTPKTIAENGEGDVAIKIDPPASGTSVWIVQVKYDPAVVRVKTNPGDPDHPVGCTAMANPGVGIAFASNCDIKDTTGDTVPDTAVAFGGWVQNDGGVAKGFTSQQTAATFTFEAVGASGTHTDLTIGEVCTVPPAAPIPNCTTVLGPNGVSATPALSNGGIDIIASQGFPVLWGDGDCDADVDPVDALKTLKIDAGQTVNQSVVGCPAYKANITVNGLTIPWGDFDCDTDVDPVDALKQLKIDAGQPVNQGVADCPAYKSNVSITT